MVSRYLQDFARKLATPATRALEEDETLPSEAHHVHVAAMLLAEKGRDPLIEAYYHHKVDGSDQARADLWAPPAAGDDEQLFLEAKVALFYDAESTGLGHSAYGLRRAAPDWARDIYRLLVGPAGKTNCAFLLACYSVDDPRLFDGVPTGGGGPVLDAGSVDADRIHEQVKALARCHSSIDALHQLAGIVLQDLQGKVSRLGGPARVAGRRADPFLFEWRQAGPARAG